MKEMPFYVLADEKSYKYQSFGKLFELDDSTTKEEITAVIREFAAGINVPLSSYPVALIDPSEFGAEAEFLSPQQFGVEVFGNLISKHIRVVIQKRKAGSYDVCADKMRDKDEPTLLRIDAHYLVPVKE